MKRQLLMLLLFSILLFGMSNTRAIPSNGYEARFYYTEDTIFEYHILNAEFANTTGLPIDNNESLLPDDIIAFTLTHVPNWNIDPTDEIVFNITKPTDNCADTQSYPDPTTMSDIYFDGPPAFFVLLPVANGSYWDDMTTAFSANFTASVNATTNEFILDYDGATFTVHTLFDMTTGVLKYYDLTGDIDVDGVLTHIYFTVELFAVLSIPDSNPYWPTYIPYLDYEVLTAEINGSSIFDFTAISDGNEWAYGYAQAGQILSVNIHDLSNLMDEGPSYRADLQTDTGELETSVQIELPSDNPDDNGMFFMPLIPLASNPQQLYDGYFGYALAQNRSYSISLGGDYYEISYAGQDFELNAKFDINNGFMTYFYLHTDNGPGDTSSATLELQLVHGVYPDTLGMHWGEPVGVSHQYYTTEAKMNGNNKIYFDDEDHSKGFIQKGDVLTLTLKELGDVTDLNHMSPYEVYNMSGPNGNDEVNITLQKPGHFYTDGPPLLYFHLLLGNSNFINWFTDLYTAARAVVTVDNNQLSITYDENTDSSNYLHLRASWNLTTGVLLSYYVDASSTDDAGNVYSFTLGFELYNSTQASTTSESTTTSTSPQLPLPIPLPIITLSLVMLVITRRKVFA